ncbi:NAD(P)H-dependent glycerol-3-phosphate dehydrogenase [Actinopolymorpha sp. B9G3]|uniref:NAD(P)H-dependent glycerol-3-phosphate dehydrogenase n=1 Tax=Actinopolymorpha sp. B9G3 TaxID=3158970 RepID=UPI0032D91EC8
MPGTVSILGAGAMGSALATPFRTAGWNVHLWGTWLDDHLLDACRAGRPHPRTGVVLADGTRLFASDQLDDALDGADLAVVAVASVGVREVVRRALAGISRTRALLLTSKGFAPDEHGRVRLLPDAMRDLAAEHGISLPPIVAVGGPCKADEVAASRWTAAVFGCTDLGTALDTVKAVATDAYRAEVTADEAGVEICAAMKNVYAITLGIADGLGERRKEPHHDLKAASFAQAVRELVVLTRLVGGDPQTATGLAGVGDLEVTGLSGRNKIFGVRIGRGEPAGNALDAMTAAEQTVEGVPAARLARTLVDQHDRAVWSRLPLFTAILDVLDSCEDPAARIADAVLPTV